MTNERKTGRVHRPPLDVERLIAVATDNPELTARQLGQRFTVSPSTVSKILTAAGARPPGRQVKESSL